MFEVVLCVYIEVLLSDEFEGCELGMLGEVKMLCYFGW